MKKEVFISFSQFLEDLIVYHMLKDDPGISGGAYIDAGANDPLQWSVTKALYEKGWRGINIEPLEEKYDALCEDRPEDINLNIGLSNTPGKLTFLKANDLSTFDTDTQNSLINHSSTDNLSIVNVDTLNNVLNNLNDKVQSDKIYFCKIDVEGFEQNVLEGIDFQNTRPWIFCIENRKYEAWEPILLKNSYTFALADSINRWYIANERAYLTNKLLPSIELTKMYDVYQVLKYDELEMLQKNTLKTRSLFSKLKAILIKVHWVLKNRGFVELCKIIVFRIKPKSIKNRKNSAQGQ